MPFAGSDTTQPFETSRDRSGDCVEVEVEAAEAVSRIAVSTR
jgi:hypothetical protein